MTLSLGPVDPDARIVLRGQTYNEIVAGLRRPMDQTRAGFEQIDEPVIVRVHNGTDSDLKKGHAIGLGTVRITPETNPYQFLDQIVVNGATPTADHRGKFAVYLENVPQGAVGRAALRGVVWARMDVPLSYDGGWADIQFESGQADDPHTLRETSWGTARVLYRGTNTANEQWGVVELGATPPPTAMHLVSTGAPLYSGEDDVQITVLPAKGTLPYCEFNSDNTRIIAKAAVRLGLTISGYISIYPGFTAGSPNLVVKTFSAADAVAGTSDHPQGSTNGRIAALDSISLSAGQYLQFYFNAGNASAGYALQDFRVHAFPIDRTNPTGRL